MGLIFHNGKFIPEQDIQKSNEEALVLRLLRSFLDEKEPGLVKILVNTWRTQGAAVTYKELREAILAGDLTKDYLEDWMQDYSRLVTNHLQPAWEEAIRAGVRAWEDKYPLWHYDPAGTAVRAWTESHAAEFVTNVSTTQIEGLRAVVRRAAVLEDITVDELARLVRPTIGLTKPQAERVMNYFETLKKGGTSEKRAKDLTIKYAAKLHRERGYDVARTELATAYNTGAFNGAKQAQADGLLGETVKIWSTAYDEQVCRVCKKMEGKRVAMDEEFGAASGSWSTKLHPPAHPRCRCGFLIKEIRPPVKNMSQKY